jgi:hypothetical protein
VDQLERGGSLAGDHIQVVERAHQHEPTLPPRSVCDLLTVLAVAVVGDDLSPYCLGAASLSAGASAGITIVADVSSSCAASATA